MGILVTLSHLIADAWSLSLIIDQMEEVYSNLKQGAEAGLARKDYIAYVLAGQDYTRSERYIKNGKDYRDTLVLGSLLSLFIAETIAGELFFSHIISRFCRYSFICRYC